MKAACLLPLVLLVCLFATLAVIGSARAEEACAGRDLMAEWRSSDPAAVAAVEKEAAAIPNGKGIFWKIEKPGIPASYLLGTMHVTDPRVLKMPDGAAEAFAAAATVVVESDEILDQQKAAAAMLANPHLTMLPQGKSIADYLTDDEEKKLDAELKTRGLPLALLSRMKPWLISSYVALPACELARKGKGAAFLDMKLAQDAVRDGKQLKGLETLVEQLSAMDDLPIEFHLKALIETLALGNTIEDVMATMTTLYVNGEIGMVLPMMKAAAKAATGKDDTDSADFEQRVIIDRNHVMATRTAPILAAGNVFMAVGALHLPGDEGLVELLRKDGFTVTALN
ncbi:TraB/GumN family protein [Rhizobium sp. RU20A]|uniref:TraB/GumN family protein n=1 Tax=Rhizobium sp. RU20A TaxID=1907412 RepID=UPI00122CF717|nr:TraB/GumN family protein [Rhizobium sp. RU20A]